MRVMAVTRSTFQIIDTIVTCFLGYYKKYVINLAERKNEKDYRGTEY